MFFRKRFIAVFTASIISMIATGCATTNQTTLSESEAICAQAIKDLSFKRQLATSDGDYGPYPDATLPKGCKSAN